MFLPAAVLFLAFSAVYLALGAAIGYHLTHFSVPGEKTPRIILGIFSLASFALWIAALSYLLALPP
jgi:hypothetical protein